MTRSQRLAPVQHVVDNDERRLARSVVTFDRRLSDGESKLLELERYRSEYEAQFAQRAATGIGANDLRDYQAFLARLADAIRQQQALVQRARVERAAEHQRWQVAATRAKALGHVVERWQSDERRDLERREQRDSDDLSNRGRT